MHGVQLEAPAAEMLPDTQLSQYDLETCGIVPAGQDLHLTPLAEIWPFGQLVHSVEPRLGAAVPTAQLKHGLSPGEL